MDTTNAQAPAIELMRVRKSFGDNVVLDDVDLSFAPGTTTCIIGRSGSGKSTLLRCVNGLETIESGEVRVDGTALTYDEKTLNSTRTQMGMVFQHFNLFSNHDVLGNVTLALRTVHGLNAADAKEKGMHALERVGMGGFARSRPERLSGGQQQRVAIARSIASGPNIMLFDEATSALDPELVKGILDLMQSLASEGMTMAVVTHEMGFAREVADQVAFIDRGRVAELAPAAQLFARPEHPALQRFLEQVL